MGTGTGRKRWLLAGPVALALLAGAGLSWWWMDRQLDQRTLQAQILAQEITRQQKELLGYSRYTSYLTVSKQTLEAQVKLLTATMVRAEGVTQVLERNILGIPSSGTVAIWYTAEYPFGFDLQPGQYDIRPTATDIEVRVKRPRLVATPAVRDLRYQILSGGLFTDEKTAVIDLYAQAARQAQAQGERLASDPAVMALCEKKLTEFLRDFLAKQPGVVAVPHIRIAYTDAG